MYCESAAWGRAARALRRPPTLPESAVSVATGSGEVEGSARQRDKHLKAGGSDMKGWMDWVREGCWQGRGGRRRRRPLSITAGDRLTARGEHPQQTNTEGSRWRLGGVKRLHTEQGGAAPPPAPQANSNGTEVDSTSCPLEELMLERPARSQRCQHTHTHTHASTRQDVSVQVKSDADQHGGEGVNVEKVQ